MPRWLLLACTILFCACCASIPPKQRVFNALPLEPEGWYEALYNDVVECAIRVGKFSGKPYRDLEWYVVAPGSMDDFVGLHSPPNRIYLDFKYTMNGTIIKHEIGHYAIASGYNGHEDAVFLLCSRLEQ